MAEDKGTKTAQVVAFLEYAPKAILQLCGALVALSLALVQIGFDEVVDAYAQTLIIEMEQSVMCTDNGTSEANLELWDRVETNEQAIQDLTDKAHYPGTP